MLLPNVYINTSHNHSTSYTILRYYLCQNYSRFTQNKTNTLHYFLSSQDFSCCPSPYSTLFFILLKPPSPQGRWGHSLRKDRVIRSSDSTLFLAGLAQDTWVFIIPDVAYTSVQLRGQNYCHAVLYLFRPNLYISVYILKIKLLSCDHHHGIIVHAETVCS